MQNKPQGLQQTGPKKKKKKKKKKAAVLWDSYCVPVACFRGQGLRDFLMRTTNFLLTSKKIESRSLEMFDPEVEGTMII